MLTIRSIELTEINLPLVHFFETSFGRTYERRIILIRVEDSDGAEGWGEITCGEVRPEHYFPICCFRDRRVASVSLPIAFRFIYH